MKTFTKWFGFTLLFMIMGLMATPFVMMGFMSCCGGGASLIESIPSWPVWPWFYLWAEFGPHQMGESILPIFALSAFGYGLLPTYFILLRALWRKLWKPCTPS